MAGHTQHETIMEYAVRMTSREDEKLVRSKLEDIGGVKEFKIDLKEETVLVTTVLSSFEIQQLLESTGFLVILRGYNHSTSDSPIEGGVITMLRNSRVCGLCRMIQGSAVCVIEGSLTGLEEGEHRVQIHSGGDITRGADSCGGVYGRDSNGDKGYLGNFKVRQDGAINFRFDTNQFKVCDVIGRSLVTTHTETGTNTYGIVARSSGVFGNRKKVCQCSGETIWEEAVRAREETIRSSL